jgi:hypothetical protein
MTTTSSLGDLAQAWRTLAEQYRRQGSQAISTSTNDPHAALVLYAKADQLLACATALAEHITAGQDGAVLPPPSAVDLCRADPMGHDWPSGQPGAVRLGQSETCKRCGMTRTMSQQGKLTYDPGWQGPAAVTTHAQPPVKAIRCQDQSCPGSLADGLPPVLHTCPLGRGLYPEAGPWTS